jgi:hypothetical protein
MFEEQCGTHYGKNSIRWACFCVNDNKDVDLKYGQTIFLCYNSPILFCNPKIQARKGLIIYNTTKWNNNIEKTCRCKSFYYCKNV